MSINSFFFILFSVLMCISSIFSLLSKKMIYTLLWAMVVFLMVAGLFLLLGAKYNSIVQFLIYVVTIPVLVAVSIMLIKQNSEKRIIMLNSFWKIIGVAILVILIGEFFSLNKDVFEIVKACFVFVNPYSDLDSFVQNILERYPILLLEFGLGLIITVIGLSNHES